MHSTCHRHLATLLLSWVSTPRSLTLQTKAVTKTFSSFFAITHLFKCPQMFQLSMLLMSPVVSLDRFVPVAGSHPTLSADAEPRTIVFTTETWAAKMRQPVCRQSQRWPTTGWEGFLCSRATSSSWTDEPRWTTGTNTSVMHAFLSVGLLGCHDSRFPHNSIESSRITRNFWFFYVYHSSHK